ncbi:unnamed protein product [Phyllotreta striolata]|uniref:Peptidase S1 domain-containing protein n=1 Tax=Phyllotreta striolata TaxID=444603 RepID=A0A9N9TPM7_PHYSR|nr:unnamed protein product [Phyllotreta striolata]
MTSPFFLYCLVLSLGASALAKPNGANATKSLKIIDGTEVVPHSRPYVVAIRTTINDIEVLCSGAIISDYLVITAATCLNGASEAEVILGAHNITNGAETGREVIKANQFIIHEKFDTVKLLDNIALIQLPKKISFNANIQSVKLPDVTDIIDAYIEKEATALGWGRTSDTTQDTSDVLRYQNLTIIPVLMCELSYALNIRPTQICTTGVERKGICRGDAGAPLVLDGVLIGIGSYGSTLGCSIGFPSVFTKISSYLSWLMLSN